MNDILSKLVQKGASKETINFLIRSLKDTGEQLNCDLTYILLTSNCNNNADKLFQSEISTYLINNSFGNIKYKLTQIIQMNNISTDTKNFVKVIGGSILPIIDISNNIEHFSILSSYSIDILAQLSNNHLDKTFKIEQTFEEQYINLLMMFNNISIFIEQLPGLNTVMQNTYKIYLDTLFHILNKYPAGIYVLYELVMSVYQLYTNNQEICFNCDECEHVDECSSKIKRSIH